jgi:2-phosphosulfolactate phosphatase
MLAPMAAPDRVFRQEGFAVRCEWGLAGMRALDDCAVVIIVDVLSFSTCVDVAVARGAVVLPYHTKDDTAKRFAESQGALLAAPRNAPGYSLSPASLLTIVEGTRLVLPSPNGASLSTASRAASTYAACLRNASAVAAAAGAAGRGASIGVIAAGERWPDGSLRPAIEDLIGAGAVIARLPGTRSPEAAAAASAFASVADRLHPLLTECASGRELQAIGFARDIDLAAEYDASEHAPLLESGCYRASR